MSVDSREQDQARLIAERIARRLSQHASADKGDGRETTESASEVAELRAGLRELQQRLAHVESHLTHEDCDGVGNTNDAISNKHAVPSSESKQDTKTPASFMQRAPLLSGVYVPATHPSTERFGIDEASAVSELVDFFENAKTCELEPGGKPCDHCAMCSSRGF